MSDSTTTAGNVRKMITSLEDVVHYTLPLGDERVNMNALIGKPIRLTFEGQINCIECGRLTKKSFGQGFCYPCFRDSPEASECILRPELCRAHEGESRDMAWSEKYCLTEQVVYLAKSSAIKVGITRNGQVPTRWLDQGASEAIVFARVPNRYTAGALEVSMKAHLTDRTNWQRMLKNEISDADLLACRNQLRDEVEPELQQYLSDDDKVWEINYPVEVFPTKVKSQSFDKLPEIEGTLTGIKGQYLILDEGRVLNIRKHTGYFISLTA
ncbi:MAG: DUF2797 domain-containing protein [Gammaproteobacteria bacterium]